MPTDQLAAERIAAVRSHERRLRTALLIACLFPLITFGATLWQGHRNATRLVDATRAGCARSTQDRVELAASLRLLAATGAVAAAEPGISSKLAAARLRTAKGFSKVEDGLRSRTRPTRAGRTAFCAKAFPAPTLLP